MFFIFNSSRKTHTKLGSTTMARGRGGRLKQKWQEDNRFPDTRVFLLERKGTKNWRGKERGQLMEDGDAKEHGGVSE